MGTILCWIFAVSLMFADISLFDNFQAKLLFAMGFIFLGTLSKAVDCYQYAHKPAEEKSDAEETASNG